MTIEIISRSTSTKVSDRATIELTISGSAVGLATDCAMGPGVVFLSEMIANLDATL